MSVSNGQPVSLKKNAFVNTLRVLFNLLFPLVTFPYASRILGPVGLGKVEFVQSVVSYFVIFSSFGIPLYGIREIGRHQADRQKRDSVFSEIFTLHSFFTTFVFLVYVFLITISPVFKDDRWLFIIFSSYIILNLLGADWYFQGVEKYAYITITSIVIKLLSLGLLFGLVKTSDDLISYSLYIISLSVGSNLLNCIVIIREVRFTIPVLGSIKRHVRPIFSIFLLNFIGSVYLNLDKVMLGLMSGEFEVGIYSAANKVVYMVIALVTSVNSVLLPRVSLYLGSGQDSNYRSVTTKYLTALFIVLAPAAAGLIAVAPGLVQLLSGDSFVGSIVVMRVLAAIVLFVGLSHFTGVVILYPQRRERVMMTSFILGATFNLLSNILLIPRFGALGAAIATVLAEGSVAVFQVVYCKKAFSLEIDKWKVVLAIVASLLMLLALEMLDRVIVVHGVALKFTLMVSAGVAFYAMASFLFFKKELAWLIGRGSVPN